MLTVPLFDTGNIWRYVPDGYIPAMQLFKRHYSYHCPKDGRRHDQYNRNRNQFLGPGEKQPLMTPGNDALFVWRKFISGDGQQGINCAIFRNESSYLSSWLIQQAELIAWQLWPGERLYTTVDPTKVKSRNPGYCYKIAGWRPCGITKAKKLLILEKLP